MVFQKEKAVNQKATKTTIKEPASTGLCIEVPPILKIRLVSRSECDSSTALEKFDTFSVIHGDDLCFSFCL